MQQSSRNLILNCGIFLQVHHEFLFFRLRSKNKRLEDKLQNFESYNEELRRQVEDLGKQVTELKNELQRERNHVKPVTTEEITQAAEDAVHDQFLSTLAYEETSGLYYDHKSGLYYDSSRRQYYDGQKGIYVNYHKETGECIPIAAEDDNEAKETSDSEEDDIDKALIEKSLRTKEEEEAPLSEEGEVSSPSPPPAKKRQKSEKELKKEERRRRKRIRKELSIPCIRMIVHSSSASEDSDMAVPPGTLFIITCKGSSVGRDESNDVILNDLACSKFHAKVQYIDKEGKYYLIDIGSQNGTFIDGQRLSQAKQESAPIEIGHGSLVKFGNTQVILHVHPGSETCLKCEPGVIISSAPKLASKDSKGSREKSRKSEMKQLRKKYGIGTSVSADITEMTKYQDRAEDRRKTVGSDNPFEKTQSASTHEPIEKSNKGFKMLSKMGYKEGGGLGKSGQGITEPVQVNEKNDRGGLGSSVTMPSIGLIGPNQLRRLEMLKKTQERFSQL